MTTIELITGSENEKTELSPVALVVKTMLEACPCATAMATPSLLPAKFVGSWKAPRTDPSGFVVAAIAFKSF